MLFRFAALCTTVASVACVRTVDVVDPAAAPVVEAMVSAPETQRWSFNHRATSASPFISCLNGIDQVSGVIDVSAGLALVEPDRVAPPILVTDSTILLANDLESESWSEAPWNAESDSSDLVEVFGEIAASYINSGIRAPDPNMTSLAFVSIASRVELVETRPGLSGQTISITVDDDRYLEELATEADRTYSGGEVPIPAIRITVGGDGRVTALEVRIDGQVSEVHGDGYVTTFDYPPSPIDAPAAELVQQVPFDSLQYPEPANSCRFQS